ncbi:MAG: arginine repressor [Firmicutes bacterium]|nr:arginine repressor [Bacillota bacterium]
MKARRQMRILEIIRQKTIETQEELAVELTREGYAVTQATVSRDIKELKLIKVPTGDGRYRYAKPEEGAAAGLTERMRRVFRDSLMGLDMAENLIVVRTLSGSAPGVGEAIDSLRWSEIAGTVAGDNTVLVVVRSRDLVPGVVERLQSLMQ